MIPDNIQWAFFSPAEHQHQLDIAVARGTADKVKDVYYKDFNGKWVRVTAVFDCIETARKGYRAKDAQYLGAVLINTKTEVPRGSTFPPVEKPLTPTVNEVKVEVIKNRKRKLENWENYGYKYKSYFGNDGGDF